MSSLYTGSEIQALIYQETRPKTWRLQVYLGGLAAPMWMKRHVSFSWDCCFCVAGTKTFLDGWSKKLTNFYTTSNTKFLCGMHFIICGLGLPVPGSLATIVLYSMLSIKYTVLVTKCLLFCFWFSDRKSCSNIIIIFFTVKKILVVLDLPFLMTRKTK